MSSPNFFSEIKRRNVYKVAVAYAVVAWLLIQAASILFPTFEAPSWVMKVFVTAVLLGFPVALIFAWAFELTPDGIKRAKDVTPAESITPRTGRKPIGLTVALAVIAAGLLAFRFLQPNATGESKPATTSSAGALKSVPLPEKSIAVLPLVNSTGDPANEYFSDGMSEEFISSLSRLQELKVVGRTSSFQFKGKSDDSRTIGEKLGVYYLLEGSVRRSADRVRIAVALIKSGDGANVWSDTYDRELKDIFAVQSEIAGEVAKQLKVALLGKDGLAVLLTTAATPSNQNIEAYNALLQGNFYSNRGTAEDYRKAIGYYEEAIRLDPRYALAYAKLSYSAEYLDTRFMGGGAKEKAELVAKARAAAEKALELDSNLAEAHLAQDQLLAEIDFNLAAAEAELRRTFKLAPQTAPVPQSLAVLLVTLGQLEEGVGLTRRAIALDPLRTITHNNLAYELVALGRYDEAEAEYRKIVALQPQASQSHMRLSIIEILRGKPGAAVELAKQETDAVWRTYGLALAHFANDQRADADAALKKLIDESADEAGSQIASVYALRKEPEKMFEWLEHAWTTHDSGVIQLLTDPFLRAYKDDPRFIAFAQKIGVTPKAAAKP
ncbi:MAG: hypothetical protein ABR526_01085 [Chthoniobacterales bacterium]